MTQNRNRMEDLRVRRTRMALQNAFIELTIEKNFSSVTVTDITERAMVNRATGITPVKRGGVEKLAKNGVHWQTLGTSTSTRATNEPTRAILPEYGVSCKRSNRKREHSRSQPERQALYLRCMPEHFYDQQRYDFLSFTS